MPISRVSFQFTDEQWAAIRSMRKSWPDGIDWVNFAEQWSDWAGCT